MNGAGTEALNTGGTSGLLIGNHTGHRRSNVDDTVRMIGISAQQLEMVRKGLHIDSGFVLRILGYLHLGQRKCAVIVQVPGALQLGVRQGGIIDSLPVVGKAAPHVVALNAQEHLPLSHGIAQAGVNGHDPPGYQGDHRDIAGNIGIHGAVDDQFGGSLVSNGLRQRETAPGAPL